MNPYLASVNYVEFLGIQFPPATKRLVISVNNNIMKLIFALLALL
jgi:hypothetical protein